MLTDAAAAKTNADDQVLGAWKQLVDVRFKLLGLAPAVSIVALATIASGYREDGEPYRVALTLGVAGAATTAAIWSYDRRNSQLHDDLISRARRIEAELGVHTGVMLGTLGSRGIVKHDIATGVVYSVVTSAWLIATVWMAVGTF